MRRSWRKARSNYSFRWHRSWLYVATHRARSSLLSAYNSSSIFTDPFHVRVNIVYMLNKSGLQIEIQARNLHDEVPCPFMAGWHPWFCVGEATAAAIVELDHQSSWNLCEHRPDKIPGTHAKGYNDVVPTGTHVPCTYFRGEPLGDHFWDDCLKSVSALAVDARIHTRIVNASTTDVYILWQDAAAYKFIQVYTGRASNGLVAVEPMSGSTDCFNNGDGLIVLQAKEEWRGSFGVTMAS